MTNSRVSLADQGFGTPLAANATKVLLLGSGELGKEVALELQRLGVEVIAADRYANAPAMQVAHRSHVLDMRDGIALQALIASEQPDLDANLRVTEVRDEGVVIRGAKLMICGTAASQEIFLLPGGIYGEAD